MDRKGFGADYEYPSRAETPAVESNRPYPLRAEALSPERSHSGVERLFREILLIAAIVICGVIGYVLGYRILFRSISETAAEERAFAQLDSRLTEIESRLDKLEANRAGPKSSARIGKSETAVPAEDAENTAQHPKTSYRVIYQEPPLVVPQSDQHLADIQKGLGALQDETKANADQLANVAGQVDAEHGEILRSQAQLDELLARTERAPYAFELRRRSSPQPVGPVSLSLKSTNFKKQRYTACVFVQGDCLELKDRSSYEVVQFSLSGDTLPYQVIVTKINNDRVAGYLEVPRDKAAQTESPHK